MRFLISYQPYTLNFRFDARTSRGAMATHKAYFLVLRDAENPERFGIGECAPLPGLSPEAEGIEPVIQHYIQEFNAGAPQSFGEIDRLVAYINTGKLSSLRFALESAALDLKNGAHRLLYDSDFTKRGKGIPINGLVWMGQKDWMQEQIREKIEKGFTTIKLKIGALDFEEELQLLKWIRSEFPAKDLTIRVDANGAFRPDEALAKLSELSEVVIHSIEQPIKTNQWEEMAFLCEKSPVPIALDEELIGHQDQARKEKLLDSINPPFIILKPTLHGGLSCCANWIDLARQRKINWWMTSALESNIGLNAISQFTAMYNPDLPQGLGTGQLYHNNIPSPLVVKKGNLYHREQEIWDVSLFDQIV